MHELRSTIETLWSQFLRSLKRDAVDLIVDIVHVAGALEYAEPSDELAAADDHDESANGDADLGDAAERDRDNARSSRRGKRGGRRHRRRE